MGNIKKIKLNQTKYEIRDNRMPIIGAGDNEKIVKAGSVNYQISDVKVSDLATKDFVYNEIERLIGESWGQTSTS